MSHAYRYVSTQDHVESLGDGPSEPIEPALLAAGNIPVLMLPSNARSDDVDDVLIAGGDIIMLDTSGDGGASTDGARDVVDCI